jgi:hypothetical protein
MAELSVVAHGLWDRAGPPPTLTVIDAPHRWCAVEVAAAPEALGTPVAHGAVSTWASWQRGMVRPGPITVSADAWSVLRSARRLYYRAHSTASPGAWVDHQVTVPDRLLRSAPSIRLCDVWTSGDRELLEEPMPHVFDALDGLPELHAILGAEQVAMLICLHRFSPKRPIHTSQLELAVALAGAAGGQLTILLQRLDYQSMSTIAARVQTTAGSLTSTEAEPRMSALPGLLGPEAARWPRERHGPFVVLRNNSPAPEDEGGTCIVVSGAGVCVYWAKTQWNGAREVVVPG